MPKKLSYEVWELQRRY